MEVNMMTKKDFKKKCKLEKKQSYRFTLTGTVLALVGLILVFAVLFLDQQMQMFQYPMQIVGYGIGATVAVIGMVFDIMGEVAFKKEYTEHLKEQEK